MAAHCAASRSTAQVSTPPRQPEPATFIRRKMHCAPIWSTCQTVTYVMQISVTSSSPRPPLPFPYLLRCSAFLLECTAPSAAQRSDMQRSPVHSGFSFDTPSYSAGHCAHSSSSSRRLPHNSHTAQYSTALYCTALCCAALHCMHCAVQHCTALHHSTYCTVQYTLQRRSAACRSCCADRAAHRCSSAISLHLCRPPPCRPPPSSHRPSCFYDCTPRCTVLYCTVLFNVRTDQTLASLMRTPITCSAALHCATQHIAVSDPPCSARSISDFHPPLPSMPYCIVL